jgi:hypothetical protein
MQWSAPGALLLILAFAAPAVAQAPAALPSYAVTEEAIEGSILGLSGRYGLTLADVRGFSDSVTMHAGTIINPDGISLAIGQKVRILGHADGKTFDANEVDTDGFEAADSSGPETGYDSGYDPYGAGYDGLGYIAGTPGFAPGYVTGPIVVGPGGWTPHHPIPRPPAPPVTRNPPIPRVPPRVPVHPRRH